MEKEQISEEMARKLLKPGVFKYVLLDTNIEHQIKIWKAAGYIKETALDRFLSYKCNCRNGNIPADQHSIKMTLAAEAILELQKTIEDLRKEKELD